jgi:hypothetical protein
MIERWRAKEEYIQSLSVRWFCCSSPFVIEQQRFLEYEIEVAVHSIKQ